MPEFDSPFKKKYDDADSIRIVLAGATELKHVAGLTYVNQEMINANKWLSEAFDRKRLALGGSSTQTSSEFAKQYDIPADIMMVAKRANSINELLTLYKKNEQVVKNHPMLKEEFTIRKNQLKCY